MMQEKQVFKMNGFLGILLIVALFATGVYLLINESVIPVAIFLLVVGGALMTGIVSIQPNQAYAFTFFGRYIGSIRESGLWLTVPLTLRKSVSLRVRNFNSKKLKVNDVDGSPIEIASVVVYRVVDSAKALFEVDDYDKFVEIQSETALRHVTSKYPYDTFEAEGYSLRGNADEVAAELSKELQDRLDVSGVEVIEARLTHLAYSTEIASAMLQRQQAKAILDARRIIVDGAVGMVQLAVQKIENDHVVELDEERKATMINNLMVAIVADRSVQPVVNTGSIY